ncbi:MAG TPA: antibiotic biosynthesis monooxygenase [Micropepsaceae bacterium]|nr:antibiotic biosynthesis monooxygenase [Micropepsaceae bacterium]
MKSVHRLIACAVLAAAFAGPAQSQQQIQGVTVLDGPIYTMTYLEVIPSATARAIAMLKEYRDASRKEPGVMFADIYQEDGQSHRFVLSEIWQNRGAVETHSKGAAAAGLEQKLKPIELGPIDMRIHQAFAVTPPKASTANDVVIISHIDVAGGNTQNLINALGPLGEASRKEPGMVQFEILDEVPAHVNHFRTFEEWSSLAAFEAHNRASHTQTYRTTVLQWLGTPYDQRLYKLVN